jgi:hypothetical protein
VLTIETANQPAILAKIAERLAEAKMNIEYTYLAAPRDAEKGLIIPATIRCRKSATRARRSVNVRSGGRRHRVFS